MKYRTLKSRAAFKKAVLERDNYTCLVCRYEGTYNQLDAEHICGRKSELDDIRAAGATVCGVYGRCDFHRKKTDGKIKWKESQLPRECIDFIIKRKWEGWKGISWGI